MPTGVCNYYILLLISALYNSYDTSCGWHVDRRYISKVNDASRYKFCNLKQSDECWLKNRVSYAAMQIAHGPIFDYWLHISKEKMATFSVIIFKSCFVDLGIWIF